MSKLERVRSAMPRDFFKEMQNCYQYKRGGAIDDEAFLFADNQHNRDMLTATTPIELDRGQLLVTGEDVVQVLANVLESTFNPEGRTLSIDSQPSQRKISLVGIFGRTKWKMFDSWTSPL